MVIVPLEYQQDKDHNNHRHNNNSQRHPYFARVILVASNRGRWSWPGRGRNLARLGGRRGRQKRVHIVVGARWGGAGTGKGDVNARDGRQGTGRAFWLVG